jgi:hypothetical protein
MLGRAVIASGRTRVRKSCCERLRVGAKAVEFESRDRKRRGRVGRRDECWSTGRELVETRFGLKVLVRRGIARCNGTVRVVARTGHVVSVVITYRKCDRGCAWSWSIPTCKMARNVGFGSAVKSSVGLSRMWLGRTSWAKRSGLRRYRRRSLRGAVWRVRRGVGARSLRHVDKNIYKIHNGRIHVKV